MRAYKAEKLAKGISIREKKKIENSQKPIDSISISFEKFPTERESSLTRSKSRGDSLNTVGTMRK